MNLVKLLQSGGLIFIAQILVWFQMYGILKIDWLKDNKSWVVYVIAIPTTFIFIHAIRLCCEAFNGDMYPSRFLTFTLGWYFNDEGITIKTAVSLLLAFSIILIQIFWK